MNKDRLKRDIIRAATELGTAKHPADQWLVPLGEREPDKLNHFVLFLKPELLAVREGAKLGPILDLVGAALRKYGVETGAVRVLNGPYLARYKIMEEHYGVINRASRLGRAALSPSTREKLEAECPGAKSMLGAHQFLDHYPEVSAFALNIIADTLGTKKVASGKYSASSTYRASGSWCSTRFTPSSCSTIRVRAERSWSSSAGRIPTGRFSGAI